LSHSAATAKKTAQASRKMTPNGLRVQQTTTTSRLPATSQSSSALPAVTSGQDQQQAAGNAGPQQAASCHQSGCETARRTLPGRHAGAVGMQDEAVEFGADQQGGEPVAEFVGAGRQQ
jgi:hypothetical protein